MAHELVPTSGNQLSTKEVAFRLSKEFSYVVVDEARGHAEAIKTAEWVESANPAIFLGRHEEALVSARRLRSLLPGEALWIQFGDEPSLTVTITVMPNESIRFGYSGAEEEQQLRPLVSRCAKVLESKLVTI